ncbi:MAG: hypothetical protein BVN35_19645 [Proteobacteria bacterium ST_bin11]|nr:MAG: hypothetical protein BVN35_19645 [Proteobacteria bacterium ST_bin11]
MPISQFREYFLGDVIFEQFERAGENNAGLTVYGVDSKVGITSESKYQSKKIHNYKILRNGMFAYNPMRLNIGSIGYCHAELREGLVSPDYVVFGCDIEKLDPEYLYFFIKSDFWNTWVEGAGVGSVRVRIYFRELINIPIRLPSIKYQKKIVSILKSFDNKIKLNRQTNQTLEQIAQAIFKSWFVDFEPVKAKMAAKQAGASAEQIEHAALCAISGKTPEQLAQLDPQTLQQLKATAVLFPDALVDSEMGEIPEEWEASKLGKHFNVVMGQSPSGDTYNEVGDGIVFFQGRRDFGFRFPTARVYTTDPKRFAQAGDTLISVRAPVGDKNMACEKCCLGRGVASIRHKSGSRSFTYAFISYIESNLSNSGSDGTVFSSINKDELNAVSYVAPSDVLVTHFEELIHPIDEQVEVLSKEIDSLEKTRDFLIPKLLSGELLIESSQSCSEQVL